MNCERCGGVMQGDQCPHCASHQDAGAADATGTIRLEPIEQEGDAAGSTVALNVGEAALQVLRGPAAGEVWVLDGSVIDIGRAADSQLFLDDVTVSRRHAVLRRVDGRWLIEDVGSLNGTYVDHVQIESETPLRTGCELQVGKFKFRFVDGPAQ